MIAFCSSVPGASPLKAIFEPLGDHAKASISATWAVIVLRSPTDANPVKICFTPDSSSSR